MNDSRPWVRLSALLLAGLCGLPHAEAHFPWLITDHQDRAVMFFGEHVADRTYHWPERLAAAEVRRLTGEGQLHTLALAPVDSDSLVGRRSEQPVEGDGTLLAQADYGIYHGTKLTYYMQHFLGADPARWVTKPADDLPLQVVLSAGTSGLNVRVLWQGKPREDCEIKLLDAAGAQAAAADSDAQGEAVFAPADIGSGLSGLLVGFVDQSAAGTVDGKDYSSQTHYLTATFLAPESIVGKRSGSPAADPPQKSGESGESGAEAAVIQPSGLPDLPETLTSFGGAIAGGVLYVYGGHTGEAHSYSTAEQSNRFYALTLTEESPQWRELPSGPRLQGLALVPAGDDVIRIGGFTALNDQGQTHELQSQAEVSRFDVSEASWQSLPPLPEPRSSHDAAVLNDHLYVAGGWQLDGEDASLWHQTAWRLDLNDPASGWESIPAPPTARRALSLVAHDGKLFALGGMKQQGGPTTTVEIYDPQAERWSAGPELPGEPMNGFGNSAFSTGGDLYVTTIRGHALRLSADHASWKQIAMVDPPRFFHRLLPESDRSLLIVGGANMSEGKYRQIDRFDVPASLK